VDVDCDLEQRHPAATMILNGRPYEMAWSSNGETMSVALGQSSFNIRISRGILRGNKDQMLKHGSEEEVISAPMPGMVVTLKVEPDQEIEIGQPLLILEAMKMENEIRSPVNGRVKQIHINPGNKVEKGEKLIILQK
jgi:biotin carboxyl carrier protein